MNKPLPTTTHDEIFKDEELFRKHTPNDAFPITLISQHLYKDVLKVSSLSLSRSIVALPKCKKHFTVVKRIQGCYKTRETRLVLRNKIVTNLATSVNFMQFHIMLLVDIQRKLNRTINWYHHRNYDFSALSIIHPTICRFSF